MLQRSPEWFKAREGRFTASRISEILGVKGMGKTGEGYCLEKAIEIVYGIDQEEGLVSYDMMRGIQQEPLAFGMFQEKKALDFINVEIASFFPFGKDAGASPDGLVGSDSILEIKCPRPAKLINLTINGESKIDKGYIDQMQFQMLCTNSKSCFFVNYAEYNGDILYYEYELKRDENRIKFIKERLDEAIKIRNEYIEKLKLKTE